eukprot:2246438-Rhodomonas_salina.1
MGKAAVIHVPPYAPPIRTPLRPSYAMSGTDLAYGRIPVRPSYPYPLRPPFTPPTRMQIMYPPTPLLRDVRH